MRMKLIIILATLMMLASSVMAGTCTISGTSGIDYTDGANITIVCSEASNNSAVFSEGHRIDIENYTDAGATTFYLNLKGETTDYLDIGCQNNIDVVCGNDTVDTSSTTIVTYNVNAVDTCTATRICLWDYETTDLDDVASDVIGTAGIDFRDNMTLIILGVVTLILGTAGATMYRRYRKR